MLVLAMERIISITREDTGKTDGPLQLFIFSHPKTKMPVLPVAEREHPSPGPGSI